MEFEANGVPTIYFGVPTEESFQKLVDLKELPEAVLEVAEVRAIEDTYLDTADLNLMAQGMGLRASLVGNHHFLIFNEVKHPGKLLATTTEHVERLTSETYAAMLAGDRSHELFSRVTVLAAKPLDKVLVRRSIFQSRLFKVGETRFEFGLEALVYERNGQSVTDQVATLDFIQGEAAVIEAIEQYLVDEFNLERIHESPLARGVQLIN